MTTDNKVDFPALGRPTNPASAISFNLNQIDFSSPGQPGKNLCGALLVEVLYRIFPKPPSPPIASIIFCQICVKSAKIICLLSSRICVPTGNLSIMSSPAAPDFCFPAPGLPVLALKCC